MRLESVEVVVVGVPPGGGSGHWLMGVVSAPDFSHDFSRFIGIVGPLTVASFLVSWG